MLREERENLVWICEECGSPSDFSWLIYCFSGFIKLISHLQFGCFFMVMNKSGFYDGWVISKNIILESEQELVWSHARENMAAP